MEICDLHTHSTYSDGTCSPKQLVMTARDIGLKAIALTDHNTIDGLDEFVANGRLYGVETVAGIEISSDYNGKELHILALLIDKANYSKINDFLSISKKRKEESNLTLARNLQKHGYNVDYDKIKATAQGQINRVHFAQQLIELGYIKSVKEGFDTILSEKNGLYVPSKRLTAFEVIDFINSIGAVSVLAHPLLNLSQDELVDFLSQAKELGLDAIETRYSKYNATDESFADSVAKRLGLLYSGGSDYHGDNKPDIKMGIGLGNLIVPYSFVTTLQERKNLKINNKL